MELNLKGKVILVDQDDTLVDCQGGIYDRFKLWYPEAIHELPPPATQKHWESTRDAPLVYKTAVQALMRLPGMFSELKPLPGALHALEIMRHAGADVFICTAPMPDHPTCIPEKLDSMRKHFGHYWESRMIFTRDKTLISADIIIDDKPVIAGLRKDNPAYGEHIYFDQPYNQVGDGAEGVDGKRRLDWGNFTKVLTEVFNDG